MMMVWDILAFAWGIAAPIAVMYVLFVVYVAVVYGHHIERIFERPPTLKAPIVTTDPPDEEVRFRTPSGRRLAGSLWRHRGSGPRRQTILFLPEYGAKRNVFDFYIGFLRNEGYDVFSIDFCNFGESDTIPGYTSLQWVSTHEVEDALAAVDYLAARPDADPKGILVFGVSKGAGAGIGAAAKSQYVRGVATDCAFPTCDMVTEFAIKWCQIVVRLGPLWKYLPRQCFVGICTMVLWKMIWTRNIRYAPLERMIRRIAPRPLLMISGADDAYVPPTIVRRFFGYARKPKELWIVPGAVHNSGVKVDPTNYHAKVRAFYDKISHPVAPQSAEGSRQTPPTQQPSQQQSVSP